MLMDTGALPGGVCVWASTSAASYLHGRFFWVNWDVEEMSTRKDAFQDPGYLKIGLQDCEHVNVITIFDQMREKQKASN
jgi:hypothetical protein